MHSTGNTVFAAGLALVLWLTPGMAWAGQADRYGIGAAAMGRGNGGICLENEAPALFYNPAAMALTPFDTFSLGGQLGFHSFSDAEGVDWNGDRSGAIPQQPLSPHSVHLSLLKRIAPPVRVGFAFITPTKGIYYYEQEDPYIPTMIRWRNRSQRFGLYVGMSVRPFSWLMLGASAEVSTRSRLLIEYAWEGTAGEGEDPPYAMANLREAEYQIRLAARPILGLIIDLSTLSQHLEGVRFGITYRAPLNVPLEETELLMELVNPGELDPLFSLADKVSASAVITMIDFYTPRQLVFGLALDRPRGAVYVDLTWSQYSAMIPNTGLLSEGREDDGGMEIYWNFPDDHVDGYPVVDGRAIDQSVFKDTWTLRVGGEIRPGGGMDAVQGRRRGLTIRLGAAYDPSMIGSQPGPTNFIDGPSLAGTAGVGLAAPDPLGLLAGYGSIDLAFQVHRVFGVTLDKDQRLIPEKVEMPVTWEDEIRWDGGWMVVLGLTGAVRF